MRSGILTMKKNLVVVGFGGMGGWHVEHALKSDVVNLLGVYDIKEERNAVMQRLGVGQWQIFGAHGFKKDYSVNS